MNKVVVIVGPTASGKTGIGIELAKRMDGEIVSADSMQVYKKMNIGTAKPDREEKQGIVHHLMDVIEPDQEFNVVRFKEMAEECIKDIIKRGKMPIVVGGTGLYINSLVDNIEFAQTTSNDQYRRAMEKIALKEGSEVLHDKLKIIDEEAAKKIHPNDMKRIIRALEVFKSTGKTISQHQNESRSNPPVYNFIMLGLNMDREKLYERINLRVELMFEKGLIREVRQLIDDGIKHEMTAMQGLGYKEVAWYLEGKVTETEMIDIIKRESRRYAKRQLTWFRRDKRIIWFDSSEEKEELVKKIITCIEG